MGASHAGRLSFGGSSAGLAVQGARAFRGPTVDQTTSDVLLDRNQVYNRASFAYYARFTDNLFRFNVLRGVQTDTHFKERNRMPRFVSFLAQTQADIEANPAVAQAVGWNGRAYGIAVD